MENLCTRFGRLDTTPDMGPSPLLSLPLEIRTLIYAELTCGFNATTLSVDEPEIPTRTLSLLLTCRQVYAEVCPMIYKSIIVNLRAERDLDTPRLQPKVQNETLKLKERLLFTSTASLVQHMAVRMSCIGACAYPNLLNDRIGVERFCQAIHEFPALRTLNLGVMEVLEYDDEDCGAVLSSMVKGMQNHLTLEALKFEWAWRGVDGSVSLFEFDKADLATNGWEVRHDMASCVEPEHCQDLDWWFMGFDIGGDSWSVGVAKKDTNWFL